MPKISIPTFDGKILSWKSFWEQFDATIHSKAGLNDIEKLTYIQDALKDSPARFMIQGLCILCRLNEVNSTEKLIHVSSHVIVEYLTYEWVGQAYRIAGNIGGELNLADWRFWKQAAKLKPANI